MIRKVDLFDAEYHVHRIIKHYPYLLDKVLANLRLKHEKVYEDGTRSDFVFADDNLSIVVEVKRGIMDQRMLDQATHYLDNEKKECRGKNLRGILVGSRISKGLQKELEKSAYSFNINLLNIDMPTKIKICDKCRRANAVSNRTCTFCRSHKFIVDPFLFSTGV